LAPTRTPFCSFVAPFQRSLMFSSMWMTSLPQGTDSLLQSLRDDFAIKDLGPFGPLNYFLGMEAISTTDGIILSQQCYILDLLRESNMSEAKPIKTPCPWPTPSPYYPMIRLLICLPIAAFLASSSICPLLNLTYHLSSTKFCSSCIGQPPFICRLSSASFDTSNPPSPMACSFVALHLAPSKPIQTPTRLAIPMTANPLMVFVSFLVLSQTTHCRSL
jgi:hypothetical protein